MSGENWPVRRRLEQVDTRVGQLERMIREVSQREAAWTWPREVWLGRTTSSSASNYPTSGDTFDVALIDAHFTASPGTQGVTETLRGSTVTARTWPAKYLPRDTEVVAFHAPGLGPSGAGQWWIQTAEAAAGGSAVVSFAAVVGQAGPYVTPFLRWDGVATNVFPLGHPTPTLVAFPRWQANSYFTDTDGQVVNQGTPALTCKKAGRYLAMVEANWLLRSIPPAAYESMLRGGYLAPNGQFYPGWGQHGHPAVHVSSGMKVGVAPTFSSAGVCNGRSHLQVSCAGTFWRADHVGVEVVELNVGDQLRFVAEAVWEFVNPPYYTGSTYMPTAEIESLVATFLYCGDGQNY